jgi:hypothetical protein
MAEIKRIFGVEGQAGHPALSVLPEIEKETNCLRSSGPCGRKEN